MHAFFFDTYAFYEIIVGNPDYAPFTKDVKIITTQLNLMELYYHLLDLYDKGQALKFFEKYREFTVPISNEIIIEAMNFRKGNYKKDMSYVDCIGYTIARKMDFLFLTGDRQFEHFDNVRFVK
jgi:uncharacterized protein